MNKARRETLSKLSGRLDDINSELGNLLEQEQEAYDNMPESLQNSDRGSSADEAIGCMQSAISEIESAMENIENASNAGT